MSGLGDKIKGKAQEAVGAAKEGVGKATGDADARASGMADKAKGQGNQAKSGVKTEAPMKTTWHMGYAHRRVWTSAGAGAWST